MSTLTLSVVCVAGLLLLIGLRLPLAFAMGIVGTTGIAVHQGLNPALALVAQVVGEVGTSSTLALLPLFILMGSFVTKAGMSHDLYDAANSLVGDRRGGLAMATVMACAGFSAICGSSLATAATMAKVAMPQMERYGYKSSLAAGSVAAGGTLGILIPPSIILVFYGTITQTSIGKLFFAAILPGLVGLAFYLLAVIMVTALDPRSAPPGPRQPWDARLKAVSRVSGVLILFIVVMGGIYVGVFTPTESASIGAAGAVLLAAKRRKLSWPNVKAVFAETTDVSAMMFIVLIGALIFANFVNAVGLPQAMSKFVLSFGADRTIVMLLIISIYIALGCVLESISMVLLTVPIFFPIVVAMGYDPLWFGIVVVVVTEIGLIHPPVGMNLYVIKSVMPHVSSGAIVSRRAALSSPPTSPAWHCCCSCRRSRYICRRS